MKEKGEKPTIGTAEAGEIFHKSKATMSQWCRERKFPTSYQRAAGCPWSIPLEDVELRKKQLGIK